MEKTTTIRLCVDKIKRHPLLQEIPFETILDYLVDFIQIVGCPSLYEEKTGIIEICDYRGILPCDYVSMIQVRTAYLKDSSSASDYPGIRKHATYRYASDSFHMSPDKYDVGRGGTDLTYKIQGGIIYTSTKNTPIEIAYKAIATDNEGFPLIPDNASFRRAFTAYIKAEWFRILFDLNKITLQSLQQALQDYAWAVGDCEAEFHRLSLDKAETLFNTWRTLIIRDNGHKTGFANTGAKEYITVQP